MMWHGRGVWPNGAEEPRPSPDLREQRRREVIESEARRMSEVALRFSTAETGTLGEAVAKAYEDMASALRILADARGT